MNQFTRDTQSTSVVFAVAKTKATNAKGILNGQHRLHMLGMIGFWLLAPFLAHADETSIPPKRVRIERQLHISKTNSAPKIDGRLDDAVWQTVERSGNFVERVPQPGAKPPVKTEFSAVYDKDNLYIAVIAQVLPGESPRALELRRDATSLFADDSITVKIDVRHDTRTTLGFTTNSAGTQLDYLALEDGEFRLQFDAIWETAAQVYPDHWVIEYKIPATSLGIKSQTNTSLAERVIGFNITRDHNLRRATYDWSEIPPQFGATSAVHYGDLEGLNDLGSGRPISLIPFVAGTVSSDDDTVNIRPGLDARLHVIEDIWAEASLLTDFSQVDLDQPQINLNQFPLFLPERRPFFLSASEFFEFGNQGVNQLFFSRRIGLNEDDQPIPLLGGLKLYGAAGPIRIGALQALTEAQDGTPGESFSVVRVRSNFGQRGHLGMMGTTRAMVGVNQDRGTLFEPSYGIGIDGSVRAFEQKLSLSGDIAFTDGPVTPDEDNQDLAQDTNPSIVRKNDFAFQSTLQWQGETYTPRFEVRGIAPDYDPTIGFIRRADELTVIGVMEGQYRNISKIVRSAFFGAGAQLSTTYDGGTVLNRIVDFGAGFELQSGHNFFFYTAYEEENILQTQTIVGRDIRPGIYDGVTFFFELSSPFQRNPRLTLSYNFDPALFDGLEHAGSIEGEYRLGKHFSLFADSRLSYIHFPDTTNEEGQPINEVEQVTLTGTGGFRILPSTKIDLECLGNINSFDKNAVLRARLRWRYVPGSDIFVVYQENLDWSKEADLRGRSLAIKISYRYDTLL